MNPAGAVPWIMEVVELSREKGWAPVEDEPLLAQQGFQIACPPRREERIEGLLLIEGVSGILTNSNVGPFWKAARRPI